MPSFLYRSDLCAFGSTVVLLEATMLRMRHSLLCSALLCCRAQREDAINPAQSSS